MHALMEKVSLSNQRCHLSKQAPREHIDRMLSEPGWRVQNKDKIDFSAELMALKRGLGSIARRQARRTTMRGVSKSMRKWKL